MEITNNMAIVDVTDSNWFDVTQTLPALSVMREEYGVTWVESVPVLIYYITQNVSDFPYGIARYTTDGWVGISFDGLTDLSNYEVLYWKYLDYVY